MTHYCRFSSDFELIRPVYIPSFMLVSFVFRIIVFLSNEEFPWGRFIQTEKMSCKSDDENNISNIPTRVGEWGVFFPLLSAQENCLFFF